MNATKYIGAHVSTAGGIHNAPINAHEIGANCFALFTRNPRAWHSSPLKKENVVAFRENITQIAIDPQYILPHDSYLINIGSPKEDIRAKSVAALRDEVARASEIGVMGVNFHPGAHLNMISKEQCIAHIAEALNTIISESKETLLIIENTAGQGSVVGKTFAEIAAIIERVEDKTRVGVCLDTCHLFAAGYDIRTKEAWRTTCAEFEQIVGLNYLRGMHLNDSLGDLASHLDRHQSLGEGHLGWETFKHIIQDERTDNMPLILETTNPAIWAEEIKRLRSFLQ